MEKRTTTNNQDGFGFVKVEKNMNFLFLPFSKFKIWYNDILRSGKTKMVVVSTVSPVTAKCVEVMEVFGVEREYLMC